MPFGIKLIAPVELSIVNAPVEVKGTVPEKPPSKLTGMFAPSKGATKLKKSSSPLRSETP